MHRPVRYTLAAIFACVAASANQPTLRCRFEPVAPALNFSLRFEAGYLLHFPFSQFAGPGHRLAVKLLIKPLTASGASILQEDRFVLPPVPETRTEGELAGSFLLDPGAYDVHATAADETGRTCAGEWHAEIRAAGPRLRSKPRTTLNRVTVFLDAAPLRSRSPSLQASDVVMLTSALTSLLEQLPAKAIRLIIFNLDTESVSLSTDFRLSDMQQVTAALNAIQLGIVDYKRLIRQQGQIAFLASLIDHELREPDRADAAIFLGPLARLHGQVPAIRFDVPGPFPHFYYLEYRSKGDYFVSDAQPWGIGADGPMGAATGFPEIPIPPAEIQDAISSTVQHLHGRTFVLLSAQDFAHALSKIAP